MIVVAVAVCLTSDIPAARLTTGAPLTVPSAPGSVPTTLRPVWTATTDPDLGRVASPAGVVVTTDRHQITAHDGSTGAVRWTYRRADRTLCRVTAVGATIVEWRGATVVGLR